MPDNLEETNERIKDYRSAIEIANLRGEFKETASGIRATLDGLKIVFEMQSSSTLTNINHINDAFQEIKASQREQGSAVQTLIGVPSQISDMTKDLKDAEKRIEVLERDKAKFLGFLLGFSAIGGGIGAFLSQLITNSP